jgi:hypothetical protein
MDTVGTHVDNLLKHANEATGSTASAPAPKVEKQGPIVGSGLSTSLTGGPDLATLLALSHAPAPAAPLIVKEAVVDKSGDESSGNSAVEEEGAGGGGRRRRGQWWTTRTARR